MILNVLRHITYILINIAALAFIVFAIYWVSGQAFEMGRDFTATDSTDDSTVRPGDIIFFEGDLDAALDDQTDFDTPYEEY